MTFEKGLSQVTSLTSIWVISLGHNWKKLVDDFLIHRKKTGCGALKKLY